MTAALKLRTVVSMQLNFHSARNFRVTTALKHPLSLTTNDGKIQRPQVRGKFLFVGNSKFFVRGVTYGTFRPNGNGTTSSGCASVGQTQALKTWKSWTITKLENDDA
jgi:hypothetical protein